MAAQEQQREEKNREEMYAQGGPLVRKFSKGGKKVRYNLDWYNKQARKLGISPEELGFFLVGDDEENLAEFNRLATNHRRTQLQNDYNSA